MSYLPDPSRAPGPDAHGPDALAEGLAADARPAPTGWRGPYLDAVRRAWRAVAAEGDARSAALLLALRAYAKDGRARGASVESLLRALDRLAHPALGAEDPSPAAARLRDWAGTQVIRAFYADG